MFGQAGVSRVEQHVRRVSRAGALQGDDRVRDVELGDAAVGQRVRVGLIGNDVYVAGDGWTWSAVSADPQLLLW